MRIKAFFAIASLIAAQALFALEPGDVAPEISASKFLAGDAFKLSSLKGKSPCVIEFFATWAEDGSASLRNLAKLKNGIAKGKVEFLAISSEKEQDLAAALAKLDGAALGFPVALDDKKASEGAYMSSEPVFPAYFLVDKDGVIVWKGQGGDLENVLKLYLAGKFSLEDSKKVTALRKQIADFISEKALNKAIDASEDLLKLLPADSETVKLRLAIYDMQQNSKQAIDFLTRQIEAAPEAEILYFAKLDLMLGSERKASAEELAKFASSAFEAFKSNPEALNNLAWIVLDEADFGNAPLALAMKASKLSVELLEKERPQDKDLLAASLDTLARLYHEAGRNDKAIETQSKAIELWKGSDDEERAKSILEYYKAAAELGSK